MQTALPSPPAAAPSDRRRKIRQWTLASSVLVLAALAGTWTASLYRDRAVERGRETSRTVVERIGAARDAYRAEDRAGAERLLGEARELLSRADPRERGPLHASVLTELAALKLDVESPATAAVDEARGLLAEAWSSADPADAKQKARIAVQRGYAEALGGDLESAQQWYEEAAALAPSDEAVRARLHLLRATRQGLPPAPKP